MTRAGGRAARRREGVAYPARAGPVGRLVEDVWQIFVKVGGLAATGSDENLRPGDDSVKRTGIALPAFLPDSEPPPVGAPDAGALSTISPLRRIGVDGRHAY